MAAAVLFLSAADCGAPAQSTPPPLERELGEISVVSQAQLNAHFWRERWRERRMVWRSIRGALMVRDLKVIFSFNFFSIPIHVKVNAEWVVWNIELSPNGRHNSTTLQTPYVTFPYSFYLSISRTYRCSREGRSLDVLMGALYFPFRRFLLNNPTTAEYTSAAHIFFTLTTLSQILLPAINPKPPLSLGPALN